MSRLINFVLFATAWLTMPTHTILGCVNSPASPVKVGQPIFTEKLEPQAYIQELLSGHLSPQDWEFALANANGRGLGESHSVDENAVAVALIHLGRTKEALTILEKLEKKVLGSYYVAANLGTAYELIGDNEKAYKWIAKGMKRNPDSHFGTEWLHLKILEAKQAIKKNPNWINTNSVLGIDWKLIGDDLSKVKVPGDRGTLYGADAIRKAIEYQLHERTEFVKPPDPVVASLLYDLSRLVRHSRSAEHGDLPLAAAHTYGYPNTSTQPPAIAVPSVEIKHPVAKNSYWLPAGIVAGLLTIFALVGIWLVRRRANVMK